MTVYTYCIENNLMVNCPQYGVFVNTVKPDVGFWDAYDFYVRQCTAASRHSRDSLKAWCTFTTLSVLAFLHCSFLIVSAGYMRTRTHIICAKYAHTHI
jgi:hypothetical protein